MVGGGGDDGQQGLGLAVLQAAFRQRTVTCGGGVAADMAVKVFRRPAVVGQRVQRDAEFVGLGLQTAAGFVGDDVQFAGGFVGGGKGVEGGGGFVGRERQHAAAAARECLQNGLLFFVGIMADRQQHGFAAGGAAYGAEEPALVFVRVV